MEVCDYQGPGDRFCHWRDEVVPKLCKEHDALRAQVEQLQYRLDCRKVENICMDDCLCAHHHIQAVAKALATIGQGDRNSGGGE